MKILQLARSRVLLWAHEPACDVPFEVSRVVSGPLQPRCPTAPRCPGATHAPFTARSRAPAACPYVFATRGECLRHRNRLALEAALFRRHEVGRVTRLLSAMGYRVEEESIDPTRDDEERILEAHGAIGPRHEVRLVQSALGDVVLVRSADDDDLGSSSSGELEAFGPPRRRSEGQGASP